MDNLNALFNQPRLDGADDGVADTADMVDMEWAATAWEAMAAATPMAVMAATVVTDGDDRRSDQRLDLFGSPWHLYNTDAEKFYLYVLIMIMSRKMNAIDTSLCDAP